MRLPAEDRYRHDPAFKDLVNMLRMFLHNTPDITPTELREAVMLAATMHEMEHVRPILITDPKLAAEVRQRMETDR